MALRHKELAAMPVEELLKKAVELKQDLAKERATIASGTRAENPGKVRKLRRDIARIMTEITAKKRKELEAKKVIAPSKAGAGEKAAAKDEKRAAPAKKEKK